MAYQDYVKELWDNKFSKNPDINKADIEALTSAWNEIKNDFKDKELTYHQIDMKKVSADIPKKNKHERDDAYYERINKIYPDVFKKNSLDNEIKKVNALAAYIDERKGNTTFGRRLRDITNGDILCGDSCQYKVVFGIAVKYDVIESYKNICKNDDYSYSRSNEECDWKSILENKEENEWLVSYPVTKPGNYENEKKSKLEVESNDFNARLSIAKNLINLLCDVDTIEKMDNIETICKSIGKSFSGLYVRACLLQSIIEIKDESGIVVEGQSEIHNSLLFQNLPPQNFIAFYNRTKVEGDENKYETWASQSKYILDNLYVITEADRTVQNTFKLGLLAWKLTLNSDFIDIDNPDYKQIIYTGAPGTGKTYGITEYVKQACLINPMYNTEDSKIEIQKGIHDKKFEQWKFVQFHSSYDYSDFVEGLRPVQLTEGQNPTFVRMDGIFKSFCRSVVEYNKAYNIHFPNAKAENTISFYFIIDEINRADIGKVFGELMYGLEESYRGKDNHISTQYMNLDTYIKNWEYEIWKTTHDQWEKDYRAWIDAGKNEDESIKLEEPKEPKEPESKLKYIPLKGEDDVFNKGFYIPENVRIIGSMNDIDRSVETFDFALRRRFQWKNINANDKDRLKSVLESMFLKYKEEEPNNTAKNKYDSAISKLDDLIENHIIPLNKVISGESNDDINGSDYGLGQEYQLGPAYFKKYRGDDVSLKMIWYENIAPILKEYIRGRDNEGVFIEKCRTVFLSENIK